MDSGANYRHLVQLGRDGFLAAAAPAALVRVHLVAADDRLDSITMTLDEPIEDPDEMTRPHGKVLPDPEGELEVFPLTKKAGASFPDRITIGRTTNNDLVIGDHSVSRLHAYVRRTSTGWLVADAGSKNGTWVRGTLLEPRRERPLDSGATVRMGDIDLTFYVAHDLYGALGGL